MYQVTQECQTHLNINNVRQRVNMDKPQLQLTVGGGGGVTRSRPARLMRSARLFTGVLGRDTNT